MKTVWGIGKHITSIVIILLLIFFNWNIVALQYCVNFCYTAQWLAFICVCHIYTHSFIFFFHFDLSQDIKYSYLCYTIGPWCPFILYIIVHLPAPNSQSIPSMIFLFKQQLKYKFINRTHWCFECSRILISTWDAEFHLLLTKFALGTIWPKEF